MWRRQAVGGQSGGEGLPRPADGFQRPADGVLLADNIHQTGKEESWVQRSLLRQGYKDEKNVLLALWDGGEKLTVFPMDPPSRA